LNINRLVIGIALALSIAAFVLALWPIVANAPWEASQEDSTKEICLKLIEAGAVVLSGQYPRDLPAVTNAWRDVGCTAYFAEFNK